MKLMIDREKADHIDKKNLQRDRMYEDGTIYLNRWTFTGKSWGTGKSRPPLRRNKKDQGERPHRYDPSGIPECVYLRVLHCR